MSDFSDDDFSDDFDQQGNFECIECIEKNNFMRGLLNAGMSIDAIKYYMRSFPYSSNHASGSAFITDFNNYNIGQINHDFKFINFNIVRNIKILIRGYETSIIFKKDDSNNPANYVYILIFPTDCDNIDFINNKITSVLINYPHIHLSVTNAQHQEIVNGFPLQGNVDDSEYD